MSTPSPTPPLSKVTVIGTGYLGATHAICMANLGFDVLGADIDQTKIETLRSGRIPFHEPGLPGKIGEALASGRLHFATDFDEVALFGDVHFVCVGTLHPDRLVFGVESEWAEAQLRTVFGPILAAGTPLIVTDLPTAELVKVTANSFLATKISFINAMAEVCEVTGADVSLLAQALSLDDRIGRRFLRASASAGAACPRTSGPSGTALRNWASGRRPGSSARSIRSTTAGGSAPWTWSGNSPAATCPGSG